MSNLIDGVANSQSRLIEDKEVLRHAYQPEKIVGRDEEINEIAAHLLDVREGEKPSTVFVLGTNGVGKTVCTQHVLREYEQYEKAKKPIRAVEVNCENLTRSYHLGAKLANQLMGEERFNPDNPGVKNDSVWDTVFNAIEDYGGVTLIMLDEIGNIEDKDSAFYQFGRAENNHLDDAVVGLVCISTDAGILTDIDSNARSSLSPETVSFSRYNANQLRELLEHRANKAFLDDAVDPEAIALAGALGAQRGGDARLALDLLRGAGELAQKQGDEQVVESHVREKDVIIDRNEVFKIVTEELDSHSRYTACALLSYHLERQDTNDEDYEVPRTTPIFERYELLCDDPNGRRMVRKYLEEFENIGLTERYPRSRSDGGDAHDFQYDLDDVHRALGDFIDDEITVRESHPVGVRLLPNP